MRLYLVRHGEAAPGDPDELRPLTPEGRAQARTLAERLAGDGVQVDALLTSPLLRARETGGELASKLGVSVDPDDRLAPGATLERVRQAVEGRGDSVLVVGHQPDCGRIVAAVTGSEPDRVAPASVITLELD
jgi:phosphohistidine phosphatase